MFYRDFDPELLPALAGDDVRRFAARMRYLLKGIGQSGNTLSAAFHGCTYSPRLQKDATILGLLLSVPHQENEPYYPAVQKFIAGAERMGIKPETVDELRECLPLLREISETAQQQGAGAWKTTSIARSICKNNVPKHW